MNKLSTNPLDYGMRKYTDLQIAEHAILIENLPRSVRRTVLEEKLLQAFHSILNYDEKD